jgi:glycosyltransferase involved in cell wall biosynthesis
MQDKPKISVISPSKNTAKYLTETIESIMAQNCEEWEHIVVDGGSTDGTIEILKRYPHIRWISEQDRGPDEAFLKGITMAKGEYIMLCCISDGYLNKNWFNKCIDVLENNPEISLVWGIDQNMLEDGTLDKIVCNAWFNGPPPSGKEYIYYWLKHKNLFHERDMCVRKKVIKECYPSMDEVSKLGQGIGFFEFANAFNFAGYLPHFINSLAAYGRYHQDAVAKKQSDEGEMDKLFHRYYSKFYKLRSDILKGKYDFHYRDGEGRLLTGKLDRLKIIRGLKYREIKEILLNSLPEGWLTNLKKIKRLLKRQMIKKG